MNLFEPVQKYITIPRVDYPVKKIQNNRVTRVAIKGFVAKVKISQSSYRGYYKLKTELVAPFEEIFLKVRNTRVNLPSNEFCLKLSSDSSIDSLDESTKLKWHQFPINDEEIEPEEIIRSWRGKFRFKEQDLNENISGLRRPQIGALHAISAYLSRDRKLEPATVVLPTGTGKTETMLATTFYHRMRCVLVLVPSSTLRNQISNKFMALGYLPELGVIPKGCKNPKVLKMTKSINSVADAEEIFRNSNVIVATASILNSSNNQAVDRLCKLCSHLFVDEAHHISAKSWKDIKERFENRCVLQFTATPFRNDKKSLGGTIIYNYTMGEAQKADYFKKIKLRAVEEYYDDEIDKSIACKAISALQEDMDQGYDHLIMARVKSQNRADEIIEIYESEAPELNPVVIHSGKRKTENDECFEKIENRSSKIVVCVDMLGEGYDLPNLKVAAIHDHYKSLAITLQFIGRFTRTGNPEEIGDATVVVNLADPKVSKDLEQLYSLGADWDLVLRRLSEHRIEEEIKLQEVIESLKNGEGNLQEQISLWNLRPSCSAILYKTNCEEWNPEGFKNLSYYFEEYWYNISTENNILVLLGINSTPVRWGNYKNLNDLNYKILIAYWDNERDALFIFSNDYKSFKTNRLSKQLCGDSCELITGKKVFNLFNGIQYPLVRNLGASQIGAISFTQYFGPNVTEGLDLIETSQSQLSNIAALGYEKGERVIWGCSERKGKVWSPQSAETIIGWSDWVKSAFDKIEQGEIDENNITQNFLRPEKILDNYAENPVSVHWGEYVQTAYEAKVQVEFNDLSIPFYLVDIAIKGRSESGGILLSISSEEKESIYEYKIVPESPGYHYTKVSGDSVYIIRGSREREEFSDYMEIDPVVVQYLDGSFSYQCFLVEVNQEIGLFDKDGLQIIDWTNTDIKSESMGYEKNENTVQYRTYQELIDEFDVIINDDDKGEAADLVAIKQTDESILLSLFHCKYSKNEDSGRRLEDLYEVCGQAQRSIRWKHLGLNYLYEHINRREQIWLARGYSRFLKGNIKDLLTFRNKSRTTKVEFEVSIVQPGVAKSAITDEMLKLLGCTRLYLKKTTEADLQVYVSD